MGKSWPALGILWQAADSSLSDLILAVLDDVQPTAVEDAEGRAGMRAFFPSTALRDAAADELTAAFGPRLQLERLDVDDEDWAARSQQRLRAVTVGEVVVSPPWAADEQPSKHLVLIRPSMGFGTGHHATTRLVLRTLQTVGVSNRTVLDIGCGSGVLALAAARLGARSASGVDVDPDAIANARENLELNELAGVVRFDEGDLKDLCTPADVVLANLTGSLLVVSAAKLSSLVKPGGRLVISGVMTNERDWVLAAFEPFLTLEHVEQEDGWIAATFGKRASA